MVCQDVQRTAMGRIRGRSTPRPQFLQGGLEQIIHPGQLGSIGIGKRWNAPVRVAGIEQAFQLCQVTVHESGALSESCLQIAPAHLRPGHPGVPQRLSQHRHRQPAGVKGAEGLATDDPIQPNAFEMLQILMINPRHDRICQVRPYRPHQVIIKVKAIAVESAPPVGQGFRKEGVRSRINTLIERRTRICLAVISGGICQ